MRNIVIIVAVVTAFVSIVSMGASRLGLPSQSTLIMPEELIAYAVKNGCEQVSDFFVNRPGMLNPPYVYDYRLSPGDGAAAALWCQAGHENKRKFFLLIMAINKGHEWAQCPAKISWPYYPRGLSVYKDERTKLEDFVYVTDPKKRGPTNTTMSGNGILSEYDGLEYLFYCYEGQWLVRRRH